MNYEETKSRIRIWPCIEIEWISWRKWIVFANKRLDDMVSNAGATFCTVSERMDRMQEEINSLKEEIKSTKEVK